MKILFFGLIFATGCLYGIGAGVVPRRDDQWPPPEFLAELKPIHDRCVAKVGVTEEAITSFSDVAIHEDELLKCYMNCLLHEYEVVDDNGEFHMEKVKERIPDSLRAMAIPILDKCFNVHVDGETQCQRAFLLHECWKKADPLHYFLV